jgi:hypothetical protein
MATNNAINNKVNLILISSQTASNSASISFTNLSSYGNLTFYVVFSEVQAVTNGGVLQLLVSTNNGSSYATTGYNSGITYSGYNSASLYNNNSSSAALLTASQNNGSITSNGFIYLYNFNLGTYFILNGITSWNDSSLAQLASSHSLTCSGTTGVNAIKFLYNNGNISSGIFTLYAISTG